MISGFVLTAGGESLKLKEGSLGFLEFKVLYDAGLRVLSYSDLQDADRVARALASYGGCVECAMEGKELIGFLDGVVYPMLAAGGIVSLNAFA